MSNMKRPTLLSICSLVVIASGLIAGCEETPVGPQVGSGTLLEALIDGTNTRFDIESSETKYNELLLFGTVTGSTLSLPVVTIRITFSGVDLDNDKFPRTLTGSELELTVAKENGQGDVVAYSSRNAGGSGTLVISATDGQVVDGTFSGRLFNDSDSIVVTSGRFSARLKSS